MKKNRASAITSDSFGLIERVTNIAFTINMVMPTLFFLVHVFTDELNKLTAFCFCAIISLIIPSLCGFFWSKTLRNARILNQTVSSMKNHAIRAAKVSCFRNLWFVPHGNIISVSDMAWMIEIKRHGATVKAALTVSPQISYFFIGILAILCSYVGFSGDFGIIAERISSLFGYYPLRFLFVLFSAYVSCIYFFSGFLRLFLLGAEK